MRLVAYDSETHQIQPGLLAPPIVCASVAELGQCGRLLTRDAGLDELERLLRDPNVLLCLANAPFDFACAAVARPHLLSLIFAAYRAGRVHDILVAQALHAIAKGVLFKEWNGLPLLSAKGTQTERYSLDICVRLDLGRTDAKVNDFWRRRYALLEPLVNGSANDPFALWPEEAKQYPVDDVENTALVTARQLGLDEYGRPVGPGNPPPPGWHGDGQRFENLQDLPNQVYTDFCLHLGAVWGFRTDVSRVELLEARAQELHEEYVERFTKVGFFRATREEYQEGGAKADREDPDEGKKDTVAVARAVAKAYGATGDCEKCRGAGRVLPVKLVPCRGVKVKGRFQGCPKAPGLELTCSVCNNTGEVPKTGVKEVICDKCMGCGFADLSTVPMTDGGKSGIPRVKTDRDTLAESGDEDLDEFGDNKHEKALKTYLPYLRRGGDRPITLEYNVLVESGRASAEGVVMLFPRGTLGVVAEGQWMPTLRECIVARPGRVFISVDLAAGELCTLSQTCLWTVRFSEMANYINQTKKPGSLHTMFAARMIGDTPEGLAARIEAGDKVAKGFRQAAKPLSFGLPGGMGVPKLVLTNRKESAGQTKAPNGHTYPGIRFCVLAGGLPACGMRKSREWGARGYEREIPPTCTDCLELVEHELKPLWFQTFPEVKHYHTWVKRVLESENDVVPCFGPWWPQGGKPHRMRDVSSAKSPFCAGANNGFQSPVADITKTALRKVVTEAYLDETSCLYQAQARTVGFFHDELFVECDEALMHEVGLRVTELLLEAYREWVPDVYGTAEPAAMRHWNKDAEAVWGEDGRLRVWEPKR